MRTIRSAPRRSVELALNAKLIDMAQDLGIDLSETVDALLTAEVLRQHGARWREENAQAIAHYNARIEREGLPLERYRTFMRRPAASDNPT